MTERQFRIISRLLELLAARGPFVLTGDFNAPRGRESFDRLSAAYRDAIPPEVTTTLDRPFHRNRDIPDYVVDGLFSSREISVSTVAVHSGLSDHCGITANLNRSFPSAIQK